MDALIFAALTIWRLLPAYLANTLAVVFGGPPPIDGGRSCRDGRRILGDGKTWRGLVGGTAGGMLVGVAILLLGRSQGWDEYWHADWIGVLWLFFLLAFGALFGDMAASFLKRRLDVQRGQKAPGLDQFDFIIMALLLAGLFGGGWLGSWLFDGWIPLLTIFIATPLLHRAVNIIGYKMGLKNEPW